MSNVFSYFTCDHERLDVIYADFILAHEEFRTVAAKQYFHQFSEGLRQHIRWEENQLFPLFEQHTGMVDTGPTAVMRREHKDIEALLLTVAEKLEQDSGGITQVCKTLSQLLKQHNMKEEKMLYPAIDDLCSDLEIKRMLAELI